MLYGRDGYTLEFLWEEEQSWTKKMYEVEQAFMAFFMIDCAKLAFLESPKSKA